MPRPHISIPPGAAPPTNPSPRHAIDDYITITPADADSLDFLDHPNTNYTPASPKTARSHLAFPVPESYHRTHSRPASVYEAGSPRITFPEPQVVYPSPTRTTLRPSASYQNLGHRSTKSETLLVTRPSTNRGESRPPSYVSTESSPELSVKELSDELSNVTLQSEEGLRRFQADELNHDEEWHNLVPPEAVQVLDKREVQRQSVLFEIIKSERDYVQDLEAVRDVFVDPLLNTSPIPQQRLKGFVSEVFWNMDEILAHHRHQLERLFTLQREQHPFIQSIAEILIDTTLAFRSSYESYIKHYPIAEAHHRKELRRNSKYQFFLSQCSQDPRTQKKDLFSFLTRPVTRLPRLVLQLDNVQKHTALDHPDQESIPLLRGLLNDLIKSSQPGIAAAESKVKFWELCESLVYQKGEILDLNLYDESRTLIQSGELARRYRADVGYNWADLHVALLDNYLLLLKRDPRLNGNDRNAVISRPIPLEYIRLASFDAPPENRKDRAHSSNEQSARFLDSFRSRYRSMYPFTIFHASAKSARRYTLYSASEAERESWHKALIEAVAVRKVRQDSNMWFAPHVVNEEYFKLSGSVVRPPPGKIACATSFTSGGKNFIAVGCSGGIYVTCRGTSDFRRILKKANVVSLHALPEVNKIIIHSDGGLESYSSDLLARVTLLSSRPQELDASREQVSGSDVAVLFVRVGRMGGRTMLLYATKSFMQVTLHALEVLNAAELNSTLRRSITGGSPSFRPFGEPIWIPKDSHDITALHKNIGICTERGIHIADPTNLSASNCAVTVIPTFNESNEPMQALKQRCSGAKPLGLVRVPGNDGGPGTARASELLVIFDELGCYINRHGVPCRSSGYLRWESKATSVAHRGEHILLFSPEFIEIRAICTGRLVQVIEGQDIRLVHASERSILVAMRGADDKGSGGVDKLVELVETADLTAQQTDTNLPGLWEEWDM